MITPALPSPGEPEIYIKGTAVSRPGWPGDQNSGRPRELVARYRERPTAKLNRNARYGVACQKLVRHQDGKNGRCFYPPDFRRGISNRWILTARPDPELENPGAGGRYAPLGPELPLSSRALAKLERRRCLVPV